MGPDLLSTGPPSFPPRLLNRFDSTCVNRLCIESRELCCACALHADDADETCTFVNVRSQKELHSLTRRILLLPLAFVSRKSWCVEKMAGVCIWSRIWNPVPPILSCVAAILCGNLVQEKIGLLTRIETDFDAWLKQWMQEKLIFSRFGNGFRCLNTVDARERLGRCVCVWCLGLDRCDLFPDCSCSSRIECAKLFSDWRRKERLSASVCLFFQLSICSSLHFAMITMSCAWQSSSLIHRVRDLATLVPDMVSVRIAAGNTISARPCCEMKSGGGKVTVCSREGEERKYCIAQAKCTLLKSSDNSCGGPAEAARFAYNDAMVVCERARSDIALLSQYFSSWIGLFALISPSPTPSFQFPIFPCLFFLLLSVWLLTSQTYNQTQKMVLLVM